MGLGLDADAQAGGGVWKASLFFFTLSHVNTKVMSGEFRPTPPMPPTPPRIKQCWEILYANSVSLCVSPPPGAKLSK